jgi:hypothetical protein
MREEMPSKHVVESFVPFTLVGERFNDEGAPLDSLVELYTYQKLVAALAKDIYRGENEDSKRLPAGFTSSFEMRLKSISEGSVVPMLSAYKESKYTKYMQMSRSELERVFNSIVSHNGFIEESRYSWAQGTKDTLMRLGSTLHDGESLGFSRGLYTPEIRQRVIEQVKQVEHLARQNVVGQIVALDYGRKSFDIKLVNGKRVHGTYTDQKTTSDLHRYMLRPGEGNYVRLTASLVRGVTGIEKITEVNEVNIFISMGEPWHKRLVELLALSSGWFEDTGEPVPAEIVDLADKALMQLNEGGYELPAIFPMPAGGIQLQYIDSERGRYLEVTLLPDEYEGYLKFNDADMEEDIDLENPDSVVRFLKRWKND